jgi:hypothetical protein
MFFLNRRMSSAKATRFSSGFISEHEILMLLANKTQKVRGKKNVWDLTLNSKKKLKFSQTFFFLRTEDRYQSFYPPTEKI